MLLGLEVLSRLTAAVSGCVLVGTVLLGGFSQATACTAEYSGCFGGATYGYCGTAGVCEGSCACTGVTVNGNNVCNCKK